MGTRKTDIAVTILGSGTCVPSLRRSACAVLMETGGARLLFDCGPGTMLRLLEAGTDISDIAVLCLSHFHPDHSGELVPFLFASKYPDSARRTQPLTLLAGRGFSAFFAALRGAYGRWIELAPGLLSITEMDNRGPDERKFDHFAVRTAPMAHNPESVAFRITHTASGASAVYSGDTDFCESLIGLSRGADLLICESALPDGMKADGHLTPGLAGRIAAEAGVRHLVLTHFYPACEQADLVSECRKFYSGPLTLAADLMKIPVTAP
ncbi:MBL fold metallo-hydrolase [Desulfonema ishimotonii]|uniref:MBL fold metallo-hydrolase n=1 Tax=Desulfonema ishimotonii TaxID=45657 RepID=A0A401G1X5_9BACT|nr:ribonuclease Z [Desulfonema ishimotonii]GBC63183.1 MBL fold metallo-hydrolase [Desulfonema ishimotonii]